MRKFAIVGMVGIAMASGGFVGISIASDETVVARLMIESVPETNAGYAAGPARGVELARLLDEVADVEAPQPLETEASDTVVAPAPEPLGTEITGTVAAPAPQSEEKVASAATTVIPAFESTKNIVPEAAPAKRKIVKVNDRSDKKRITLPVPIIIGAFR